MKAERRVQSFAGFVIAAAVIVFVLAIFSMLSKNGITEKYLADRESSRFGWTYEVLSEETVTTVVPEFSDEFTMSFPVEEIDAVRIERVFTEEYIGAALGMRIFDAGIEVFLEDRLLYSDFQGGERNQEGFLLLDEEDRAGIDESFREIRISLPEDYLGKRISMITYFGKRTSNDTVVFPTIGNDATVYGPVVTSSVIPIAVLTVCAVLAILMVIIFWVDITNGPGDIRILWMVLFSVLLFLDRVYESGDYSVLNDYLSLKFLQKLYMAPLFLYLASQLKGRKSWLMSGLTVLWFFYELIKMFQNFQNGLLIATGRSGMDTLFLFLLIMAMAGIDYFRNRSWRESFRWYYAALMAVVTGICILYGAQEWEGDIGFYLMQIIYCVERKNCFPAVALITDICAIMTVIFLVVNFIERTWKTKAMVSVLEERSRLTMEGYNRMVEAETATKAARHELRHHMTAILGMLEEGDVQRAQEYVHSVDRQLKQLPVTRYSGHILVNAVAGAYLDRAKELGIEVFHRFAVPEKLNIADEDLCVFLTNMLENALEACERMEETERRYIRVAVTAEENILFLACINSVSGNEAWDGKEIRTTKKDGHKHGYGIKAMEKIAKKYNGILEMENRGTEISVKSNLYLPSEKRRPESKV